MRIACLRAGSNGARDCLVGSRRAMNRAMGRHGHRGMAAGAVAQPQPAVDYIQLPAVAQRIADIEAHVSARGLSRDRSKAAVAVVFARGSGRLRPRSSPPAVVSAHAIADIPAMPQRFPPRPPRAAAVAADQHPQSREV